jgi:hypothetical protein
MLLHPTYFPSIAHFIVAVKAEVLKFEVCDNYQKQTYRNRAEIYGANGKLALTVPVIYSQKNRQLYKEVCIFNDDNWQQQHLKSLESAYRTSPFFEYYIDELLPLFESKFETILELNLKCFDILCECLQIELPVTLTKNFEVETANDFKFLVNARKDLSFNFQSYTQVFTEKYGYISNLSILDLLFNEGPNTINYLEKQNLPQDDSK